jgi:hypothetical protein
VSKILAKWYRATCFGEPKGPWRDTLREVQADLEAQRLGSYDEWLCFYITVPGGIEVDACWMDFETWEREKKRFSVRHPRRLPNHTADNRKRLVSSKNNRPMNRIGRAGF